MKTRKIEKNVFDYLSKASAMYGKIAEERFSQEMYCNLIERGISSPIEDLFYIACNLYCYAENIPTEPEPEFSKNGDLVSGYGLFIQPQVLIGQYRVDFLLSQNGIGPDYALTPVVVELDGHAFHDKDKRQRAYEKARDRFLVKSGYRVLHFTGSEIVADPLKAAHEALTLLGVFCGSGIDEYDAKNPFGIE